LKLILAGVATEILLIALSDYTPWGHELFGTASIAFEVWLFILPFSLVMFALEELRKWFVRSSHRPARPSSNTPFDLVINDNSLNRS
jgi:sodium/potassium-transporting ATPase subunit alpha